MLRSSLENGKEAHLVILCNFKQKADVKMYIQFPDYDDFRGYDLGLGGNLSHIARKIYANFHKPSWRALKHYLLSVKTPKKLHRELNAITGNDKRAISKQERMFGTVAKIPIGNTFIELVEMDFVNYGDFATFLRIRNTFHVSLRLC